MLVSTRSREPAPRVGNLTIWDSLKLFFILEMFSLLKSSRIIMPQLANRDSIVVKASYK